MIARDPQAASCETHDLLVVGGGVYGAALALEAARHGLRPLLLEREDFGGATSWNSLRIVHGGLRYLQSLDLHRFRESVGERRWWLANFPDLVRPLACLMPLYGRGLHRPGVLRAALALNDLLSIRQNRGLPAGRSLPPGRVLTARQTVARFPRVRRTGLKGAALWHDGAMPDSQRLILEMMRWACAGGATALNYVEATGLRRRGGAVEGIEAVDRVGGDALVFRAPVVVNCAGPWCREVAATFDRDLPELFALSIAFNVLLDRPPLSDAVLAVASAAPGARTYFLHPWKGKILAGTYHAGWTGSRAEGGVDASMLQRFLDDLNSAVPGLDLTADEVLRVHWGFLPAHRTGTEELAAREVIRHHADAGGPAGLFSVSGVKFTTARLVAEKVLRAVLAWRGGEPAPALELPRPAAADWPRAAEIDAAREADPERFASDVRRIIDEEAVVHLDDLLLRRTDWGWHPGRCREIGNEIVHLAGWDETKTAAELERLRVAAD